MSRATPSSSTSCSRPGSKPKVALQSVAPIRSVAPTYSNACCPKGAGMMGHVPARAWGVRLHGALVRVAWPCVLAATPFHLVSRTNPALGGMRAGLPRGGPCHRVLPGTSRKGARASARSGRSAGLGVHGAWHRPRVGADSHGQEGGAYTASSAASGSRTSRSLSC